MSEYTPITGELRERIGQAEHIIPLSDDSKDMQVRINLAWLTEKLNAIDSIHAQLERENASLKTELNRVLGEQEEHAHTRGESITGELREVAAKTECANGRCEKLYRGDLERIADCIDVEHKRAVMSAMNDALYHANDESMAELGWVRLPKDEDGVSIRVGDMLAGQKAGGGYCEPFKVVRIDFNGYDWIVYASAHAGHIPDKCRHYQPDTWERIIEDAIDAVDDVWADDRHDALVASLVARCKALCARTKEDA